MVGAVLLGEVGILCHLAVRRDYRKLGLGSALSSWSVSYLRSRGAKVVRLDSTRGAKRLYESLGFESVSRRSVYRMEGGILTARLRGSCSVDEQAARTRGLRVTPLLFSDLPRPARPARPVRRRSLVLRRGSFRPDPSNPQPAPRLGTNHPGCLGADKRLPRPQRLLRVYRPDRPFDGFVAGRCSRPARTRPPDRRRPFRRGFRARLGRKPSARGST